MKYKCQDCGKTFSVEGSPDKESLVCTDCGGKLWEVSGEDFKRTATAGLDVAALARGKVRFAAPREKYAALRILSHVYRGLAFMCVIVGMIAIAVVMLQARGDEGSVPWLPVTAALVLVMAMGLVIYLSAAEAIQWLIDMEWNSRKTNTLLSKILEAQRKE